MIPRLDSLIFFTILQRKNNVLLSIDPPKRRNPRQIHPKYSQTSQAASVQVSESTLAGPWSPECPECRMRQRCSIRKIKRSPEIKVNDFMTYIDDKNCSNYFLAALTSFSKISFHSFLVFSDSNLRSIPPPRLKLTVRHLRLSVSDIVLDLTGGPATTLVTYIVKKSE